MPWREMSPMEQRLEFIPEYDTELFTMTELAAQYGVSRKTAYKWLARYEAQGELGMLDRSRRPHQHPHATDPKVMALLLSLRKRHPRWGAKKLLKVAKRRHPHIDDWPSRSTVCDHLKAHQLVAPRRRRGPSAAPSAPVGPITAVNEVWTTDFKGEFRTGDAAYCYPLTLRDGWSRFVLRCDALTSRSYEATRRRFERAFNEYGLPKRIRSDNGGPFASTGLGRLSRLSVWWMRLGIVPERIALGHPEQNGSHEQFHSVLKADTARPPAANAAAQQRRFTRFCREYNYERPHEALHDDVPASVYHSSPRRFRRVCRRSSILGTSKSVACPPTAVSRGPTKRSFSPKHWLANTSGSKKSTMVSGPSALLPLSSVGWTSARAEFIRLPRSLPQGGAPPAALAP